MATGGFKLSLAGAKGKPGLKNPLENPTKRRRLALDDDEPEDTNVQQEITGWNAAEGGALDANAKKEEPKGPRIIAAIPNRNWRDEAQKRQRTRTGTPAENGSGNGEGNMEGVEQADKPKMAFGLTTFDKKDDADGEEKPEPMDVDGEEKVDARTEEEKLQAAAYDALVTGKVANHSVIPISEEEALHNDLRDAPEAPTLAAYQATPVEGFGAAMLRGMGWKDDEKPPEKPKEAKKRPALLGIGAKPESAAGVELGQWDARKGKGGKPPKTYNPVALRNKRTGEMVTEEELQERLAKQKEADEKAARNNKFVGDEDEEDERRREKRRERKERERRDDDHGREKSRRDDRERRRDRDGEYSDRDRRREKKHRDDDYENSDGRRSQKYSDSDRDRRRDKKYRDDDYDDRRRDKDRRRDRSRSPYDDERREKRRERDRRDRSVDSKDRREKRRDRSRDEDDWRKRRENDYQEERDARRNGYKVDKWSRR